MSVLILPRNSWLFFFKSSFFSFFYLLLLEIVIILTKSFHLKGITFLNLRIKTKTFGILVLIKDFIEILVDVSSIQISIFTFFMRFLDEFFKHYFQVFQRWPIWICWMRCIIVCFSILQDFVWVSLGQVLLKLGILSFTIYHFYAHVVLE